MKKAIVNQNTQAPALIQFENNQRLAYFAMNRFFPHVPQSQRDDIKTIALLGLWAACQMFNPTRGYQFSTYAVATMKRHFMKAGLITGERQKVGTLLADGTRPLLLSADAPMSEGSGDTFGDLLRAGKESDPLHVLIHAEEVEAAKRKFRKVPRFRKVRNAEMTEEAVALWGEDYSAENAAHRTVEVPTYAEREEANAKRRKDRRKREATA